MIEILRLLSQTLTASIASSARPALTFTVIQISVAVMVHLGWVSLPETFDWLIDIPAIVLASILTIAEYFAQHDESVAELLRELQLDKILSAFGAFSSALLFVSLGLPEDEAAHLITGEGGIDVTGAAESISQSQHSTAIQTTAIVSSLGLNFGLSYLRAELYEYLSEIELDQLMQRFETGGVLLALVLLIFAPFIALAFFIGILIFMLCIGLIMRSIALMIDSRSRTACSSCQASVRHEALICFKCQEELTPVVWLNQTKASSLSRFKSLWRTRKQSAREV